MCDRIPGLRLPALLVLLTGAMAAQPAHSVARVWNEAVLQAIRNDFARPTVHARNLFHTSVAMYDAWAAYDATARPFLLGRSYAGVAVPFTGVPAHGELAAARHEAISYAVYRIARHRFRNSPRAAATTRLLDSLFITLGYDSSKTATNYSSGDPSALGNYIAQSILAAGLQDGSNEQYGYANLFYEPLNPPMAPAIAGNPDIIDLNRWQPLAFETFIDQSGNVVPGGVPLFLSPEWGAVAPFALPASARTTHMRDGFQYVVYHDPGPPPYIDTANAAASDDYKWGFELVAVWSAHLDPSDSVMWDVSPSGIGNVQTIPSSMAEYRSFYDRLRGGDHAAGRTLNPKTGQPYAPQMVPRGDYARVLAEFWADGPDSETPPGHWFTIFNYVTDHPQLQKRYRGSGPALDDLEWDVKAYFALGGAMHDAAIAAWGIKGRYDYIRPVSAIRAMAARGQSSDTTLLSYHPAGLRLIPGYIEIIQPGDSLQGKNGANVGKIKLKAWRGPGAILDPATDVAGVGWILAEHWWPYQRPTFVTPPFAGYISGHSTYSRAAAELMTALTGDEYFPGGIGEFSCPRNAFLVFEQGPSTDVTLQWATYRDASDQCSLSRIWGGIHPPADDLPGRRIGAVIGVDAFRKAEEYFLGTVSSVAEKVAADRGRAAYAWPNPVRSGGSLTIETSAGSDQIVLYNMLGQAVRTVATAGLLPGTAVAIDTRGLSAGVYFLRTTSAQPFHTLKVLITR